MPMPPGTISSLAHRRANITGESDRELAKSTRLAERISRIRPETITDIAIQARLLAELIGGDFTLPSRLADNVAEALERLAADAHS